jgi:hypothetical protein
MSELIRMSIEIGGTFPASLADKFLNLVNEDLFDISDGYTKEELLNQDPEDCVFISGTANYGLCHRVFKFCAEHNLTYVHNAEAMGDIDAEATYWEPGMEEAINFKTDSSKDPIIKVSDIEPLLDLMCALISKDQEALPLFLNDPATGDLVKIGLESPEKFSIALKERIDSIIPDKPPKVPPFLLDHCK